VSFKKLDARTHARTDTQVILYSVQLDRQLEIQLGNAFAVLPNHLLR